MDKVEGPVTSLIFLGLELDSVLQLIKLPQDKLQQLQQELQLWKECKKTTKRKLLLLNWKLAFAARAVPAGRLFTRRLITLSSKVSKLHHGIKLNKDAKNDNIWWQQFLPGWNEIAKFITENVDVHDLACTQMPPEDTAVGHTSKEPGSFTCGNHTNVSQNQYQSNGKSYLPS